MAKITFSATGETHECPDGTSLLDFCQTSGASFEFGCTVGSCGTCICTIEAGHENVNAIDDEERETVEMCSDVEGARLGCQLTINGDVTIRHL